MKKIVSNVFYYFLDVFTLTVLGYIFWILIGRLLTREEYGILFTIISFSTILTLITTLGFQEALPKFIPELLKKGKKGGVRSMVKFSIKTIIITSLIISFLIFYFSEFVALSLYNSEALIFPLKLSSVLVFAFTISATLKSILQGFQKFKIMFVTDTFSGVIKILSALILVLIGFKVLGGVFAWVLFYLSTLTLYFFFIHRIKLGKKNGFNKRVFLKFCSLSFFSSISNYFVMQGGIIILSFLSSFESVGLLSVAYLFGMLTLFVPSIISGAIFPSFSELLVRGKKKVERLLTISVKIIVILVLPFVIFLSVFSKFFIELFFSSKFLEASFLFPSYLFAFFLMGISSLFLLLLYSAYKPRTRLLILSLGMLLNILLCFLLIPYYDVYGAVLAFLTTQIFIFTSSTFFVNKILPLRFSKRSTLLIPNSIIFLLILLLSYLADNILIKLFIIFSAFSCYFILLFKLKIINKKDLLILNYFPNKFGMKKFKNMIRTLVYFFK
jgi:O-antigen/teichoic acid export membrane protein